MKVKLTNVRLAFPHLWEPTQFKGQGPASYKATFLFPADHTFDCKVHVDGPDSKGTNVKGAKKAVQQAIKAVAEETWKDKAQQVLDSIKGNPNKFCFQDGNTKSNYDGFEDSLYISASRRSDKKAPEIVGLDGQPITQSQGIIYGGCYVNGIINFWAQDNDFGKGIRADLLGVQFYREGDAFSAGNTTVSSTDFEDLSDGADAPDLDDEEPSAAGGLI